MAGKWPTDNGYKAMLLFKVRKVLSPHMAEFRGFRMCLATPNDSGPDGQPSFGGRNLVAQSSDLTDYPTQLEILTFINEWAKDESVTWLPT